MRNFSKQSLMSLQLTEEIMETFWKVLQSPLFQWDVKHPQ
jgi:hypothetical protein